MLVQNEMRIGNWYNFQNPFEGGSGFQKFDNYTEWLDFEYYGEPILLSPEILTKCGFHKRTPDSENVISVRHENNVILNQYKSDSSYWFLYPAFWWPTSHIKYLHQLQNLTFALTGQELTYNPHR